ncbi:hypothetical protein [Polynucleobacter necessarius]|uniref:hypothetical protein n=1 Tax=Polynucleobacter necessarius TaxID=576610 RepID=UPI000E094890|nr:hypothetical protein [Polynucleobacter necessarius]HAT38721.1 hypothetical protein [Polynucleobacter sp.]
MEKLDITLATKISVFPLYASGLGLDQLRLAKAGGLKLLEFQKLMMGELGFDEVLLVQPTILVEKKLSKARIYCSSRENPSPI